MAVINLPHNTIVCLMGPTASGKTALAIELVQMAPMAIVSVDSSMVYLGMDIGSAKPNADELTIAPHRLINIRDPKDSYSAAQFRRDAINEIEAISQQQQIPLLVGGTMLYFQALEQGLSNLPPSKPEIRNKLMLELEHDGVVSLYEKLERVDAASAERLKPNDKQRIMRALEVYLQTGKPMSQLLAENRPQQLPYNIINIGLIPSDRAVLHQRVELRVKTMLQQGLIDEVKQLYNRGDLNADLPSMRAVGYRQVWPYLDGKLSYAEMVEKIIIATRQLAKRQLTWLRSWPNINYLDMLAENNVQQILELLGI